MYLDSIRIRAFSNNYGIYSIGIDLNFGLATHIAKASNNIDGSVN